MDKAFYGQVLWVDLSSGRIETITIPEEYYREYIGGSGLAARIIMERQGPHADPLGEENILGILPGLLGGTNALFSGRYMVVGKSPLTGGWTESNSGGYFAGELKRTGYDGVFFRGIAPQPVYLWIKNDQAEIREAAHLWGKDTVETEKALREELGDARVRVAAIGPAGENRSLLAGVVNDGGRIAARGGLGAVMGAKRLKAVAVRGTKKVPVFDAKLIVAANEKLMAYHKTPKSMAKLLDARLMGRVILSTAPSLRKITTRKHKTRFSLTSHVRKLLQAPLTRLTARVLPPMVAKTGWELFKVFGTSGGTILMAEMGDSPIKNWGGAVGKDISSREIQKLSHETFIANQKKKFHCDHCPIGCGSINELTEGRYKGTESHRPEYESIIALGPLCLNSNPKSIQDLNEYCNRMGIDTISAGAVMAFAIECFEKGILTLEDTNGLKLGWGDPAALEELLRRIVHREGIGDLLADGVKAAMRVIGRGSYQYAIHAGGQELPMHHPLRLHSLAAAYSADPAVGRHTNSCTPYALSLNLRELYPELFAGPLLMFTEETRERYSARLHAASNHYLQVVNAAGLCNTGALLGGMPLREWVNAATGWDLSPQDILTVGKRMVNLKQLFNRREGLSLSEIRMPTRTMVPP
ncbi:MAG: aldehyde ferredoxin oxidoreductase family protein, partial [bacterium]|nr:aldehyde ferredoxin oxidoreductase family protein [bacterium]